MLTSKIHLGIEESPAGPAQRSPHSPGSVQRSTHSLGSNQRSTHAPLCSDLRRRQELNVRYCLSRSAPLSGSDFAGGPAPLNGSNSVSESSMTYHERPQSEDSTQTEVTSQLEDTFLSRASLTEEQDFYEVCSECLRLSSSCCKSRIYPLIFCAVAGVICLAIICYRHRNDCSPTYLLNCLFQC